MGGLSQVNFNSGTVFVDGTIQATTIAVNGRHRGRHRPPGWRRDCDVWRHAGRSGEPARHHQCGRQPHVQRRQHLCGAHHAERQRDQRRRRAGERDDQRRHRGDVATLNINATSYTIVNATGPVSGTFSGLTFAGPLAFTGSASLSYDPNDVFLNIGNGFVIFSGSGANQNQQNVINGINNFILNGGTPPGSFQNLANLSGPAFLNALTQLSGENNAGFFQGAFQAGNSFLNLMVNPFLDGRFGNSGGFGAATGFAAEEPPALPQAAAAFASAMPVKAAPAPASFSSASASGAPPTAAPAASPATRRSARTTPAPAPPRSRPASTIG